ncbi:MAG TPA: hypothetical protein VMT28_13010 [Terriglobales bacterium]|nr:hypothetical protein [Terriglobales bacterium]
MSLGSLGVAFVLCSTVMLGVTLGILAAYGTVTAILHFFAHQTRQAPVGTPILIETPASGD